MAGTAVVSVVKNDTTSPPTFQNVNGTEIGQLCRAWVNFNGTTSPGTIRAGFNVSSVTRNAVGDYTVNFTNALPDANYAFVITSDYGASNSFNLTVPTTTSARCATYATTNAGNQDRAWIGVSIFR